LPNLKPVATARLWKWAPRAPALAASTHGRYVAVAGSADHSIRVFSIESLLKNEARSQQLRSVGITMRSVAFIQKNKGQDLGLMLDQAAKSVPGRPAHGTDNSLVFDFSGRSLSTCSKQQEWQVVDAAINGWRVKEIKRRAAGKVVWRVVNWEGLGVTG